MKEVTVSKKGNQWVAKTGGGKTVAKATKKADAVKRTATAAKKDPNAVSVRIHKAERPDSRGAHVPPEG